MWTSATMMSVRETATIPEEARFSPYAEEEWALTPEPHKAFKELIRQSRTWVVYYEGRPVCMVGVLRLSLVGSATRVWMVAFSSFRVLYSRLVRFLRRGVRKLHRTCGSLSLVVHVDYRANSRFAEFLGFKREGQVFYQNGAKLQTFFLR